MARALRIPMGLALAVCVMVMGSGCSDDVPGPTEPRATPAPEITALSFSPTRVSADALPQDWSLAGDTIEGRVVLEAAVEDPIEGGGTVSYAIVGVPPLGGTVGEGQLSGGEVVEGVASMSIPATDAGYYAIIVQATAADGRQGPPARGTLRFDPASEDK